MSYLEIRVTPSQDLGRLSRVWIFPECGARGMCRDLMHEALRYAFGHLHLARVELTVLEGNDAALRCYRGAGFIVEGRSRNARRLSAGRVDAIQMGVVREEWSDAN